MNRRQFSLAALSSTALLGGCRSGNDQPKPARDATLLHNSNVRAAVADLQTASDNLEMRLSQFNAENWQDALSAAQVATTRLLSDVDELKRTLGYPEGS